MFFLFEFLCGKSHDMESHISDFLTLCDLQQYTEAFLPLGVNKPKHLLDVDVEDFRDIGKFVVMYTFLEPISNPVNWTELTAVRSSRFCLVVLRSDGKTAQPPILGKTSSHETVATLWGELVIACCKSTS